MFRGSLLPSIGGIPWRAILIDCFGKSNSFQCFGTKISRILVQMPFKTSRFICKLHILQYPFWLSSSFPRICWWYFNSKWPENNPVSNLIPLSSWISFWYLFFIRNTNFLAYLRQMWFSHTWENLSSTSLTLGYHEMVLSQLSYVGFLSLLNSLHIHYGYGLHNQGIQEIVNQVHLEM